MGSLYSEHFTWLHRWAAMPKLLCIALGGTLLFLLEHIAALAVAALLCALLLASLGAATRPVRGVLRGVLLAAALVAVFHAATGDATLGAITALRLASASMLGAMLTVSTRSADIVQALQKLLAPLRLLGLRPDRLSLQLGLMLRFAEHFFVQWKKLDEAYRLRTGRPGGWRLLAPLAIQMLQTARRVGDALYLRMRD